MLYVMLRSHVRVILLYRAGASFAERTRGSERAQVGGWAHARGSECPPAFTVTKRDFAKPV